MHRLDGGLFQAEEVVCAKSQGKKEMDEFQEQRGGPGLESPEQREFREEEARQGKT